MLLPICHNTCLSIFILYHHHRTPTLTVVSYCKLCSTKHYPITLLLVSPILVAICTAQSPSLLLIPHLPNSAAFLSFLGGKRAVPRHTHHPPLPKMYFILSNRLLGHIAEKTRPNRFTPPISHTTPHTAVTTIPENMTIRRGSASSVEKARRTWFLPTTSPIW